MNDKVLHLLKKLSKTPNFKIISMLEDGAKRWSELERIVDKKSLYYQIQELIELGITQPTIIHNTATGSKAYALTPFGRKIVKLINEIEKLLTEADSGHDSLRHD